MVTEAEDQERLLDETMAKCLDPKTLNSVFLFAGAGSGKTRAIERAMGAFRGNHGARFRREGKRVAIITYTNAACEEIRRRVEYDPIFAVSTIHSFAWEQIQSFQSDISKWLHGNLTGEIEELLKKQSSGRASSKAAVQRAAQIESKRSRLDALDSIRRFTYNPNGENVGKESLSHSEVIAITTAFLKEKPSMQRILIQKYPVILVDESQDTQKDLMDALLVLQQKHSGEFSLSLFGDTMQRIYADGKVELEKEIPDEWEKPAITVNHRCPKRVIELINKIRELVDDHQQSPRNDAIEGLVRLFIVDTRTGVDTTSMETEIAAKMAELTDDESWQRGTDVKTLTLEHHMAARRGGFDTFFEPLYQIPRFKTGLLDGTLSGIAVLRAQVMPLINALREDDKFAIARVVRAASPMLSPNGLKGSESSLKQIQAVRCAVQLLAKICTDDGDPTLLEVLKVIVSSGLFVVPEVFTPILKSDEILEDVEDLENSEGELDTNQDIEAWEKALTAKFSQFEAYVDYISEQSAYGTHQGIKGLQFPRVMVILDDNEARGFMFSYDKLLGAKQPSTTDQKNLAEGKETTIDRTRRLLYVTCSRAQQSLAVVVYTKHPDLVGTHIAKEGWFDEKEVIRI